MEVFCLRVLVVTLLLTEFLYFMVPKRRKFCNFDRKWHGEPLLLENTETNLNNNISVDSFLGSNDLGSPLQSSPEW